MKDIKPEYIKSFINDTYPVKDLPKTIFFFLLLLVDLFMLLPIFATPYDPKYLYILLLPIILIHVFGLIIVVNPYKYQVLAQLYLGVFGSFVSLGYLVLTQKFVYSMMKVHTPYYAIASFGIYIMFFVILFRWHSQILRSGYLHRNKSDAFASKAPYFAIAAFGVFAGQVVLGTSHGSMGVGILTGAYLLLACAFMTFSLLIQKYRLMIKHPEWIKPQTKGD